MPITAFLTDSTLCIGCKACEVACKEWNQLDADSYELSGFSYDNTGTLGHSTWRHVWFVEHEPQMGAGGAAPDAPPAWNLLSDVCKHCEVAGCLEACPTGALVRTEFGGVYLQPDVCNGCAYCVVSCPFGVVERNPEDGRAFKCTFCYDRQKAGMVPACAKACPTESIQFGELEEVRQKGRERVRVLRERGMEDVAIWDPQDSSVRGTHAIFIHRGDPRQYNLPPNPEVPTEYLTPSWGAAALGAGFMLASVVLAFLAPKSR